MKKLLLSHFLFLIPYFLFAQNIGINTTTPQSTLDVKGNQRIGGGTKFMSYDTVSGKIIWNNSNLFVSGSQYLMQHSSSAEGLFYGNGNLLYRGVSDTAFMTNWGTGETYIRGNLGIGVVNSVEKLHVMGNVKGDTIKSNAIKLSPNAGVGKVLTSDASGNGSWQDKTLGGSVGFGVWGDCGTNANISEYQPVTDTSGLSNVFNGAAVSISGIYAIVGAPQDDINGQQDQGSASIYKFDGNKWVLMQKLTNTSGSAFHQYGYSVSISGSLAIVGAPYEMGGGDIQGAVYLYKLVGNNWVFAQRYTDQSGYNFSLFGYSVSISGNFAAIGAMYANVGPIADQGTTSIYYYDGAFWGFNQLLVDPDGNANDNFGYSVCLDGNNLIVGVPYDDIGPTNDRGSACIFIFNGTNWVFQQKLVDPDGAFADNFGLSVSISANNAVIGAPGDDVSSATNKGSAIFFRFNGSTWVHSRKVNDATHGAFDVFGSSVSISGDYALIGSWSDESGTFDNQGSATIYVRFGASWGKLQYIFDPMAGSDGFGYSVAMDASTKRFVIGSPYFSGISGKATFGKMNQ